MSDIPPATAGLQHRLLHSSLWLGTQAKVDQLQLKERCLKRGSSVLLELFLVHLMFIINENVLRFKVPVSVASLMNVCHRCSNL